MVDALLNVKFLLVREHQIGQHAIFHEVQQVSTSFDPHSFMRGCELMALLHLVGEGLEVLLKDAAHRSLADCSLCGQLGRRTTGIGPQLFPRVFNHSLGLNCSLSALARSNGCLVCHPELLDHFQTRFTPNLKLFCDGRITLTLFMEAYDCFSVYTQSNFFAAGCIIMQHYVTNLYNIMQHYVIRGDISPHFRRLIAVYDRFCGDN